MTSRQFGKKWGDAVNDPAKNKKLAYTLGATSVIALSIGMNSCAIAQTRLDAIEVQVPTQKPTAKKPSLRPARVRDARRRIEAAVPCDKPRSCRSRSPHQAGQNRLRATSMDMSRRAAEQRPRQMRR